MQIHENANANAWHALLSKLVVSIPWQSDGPKHNGQASFMGLCAALQDNRYSKDENECIPDHVDRATVYAQKICHAQTGFSQIQVSYRHRDRVKP